VHVEAGDLLDVNVWLALAAPSHVHHAAARAYWMQPALPRLWFNRITMLGLVRLLCEPKVMGAATLSTARALEVYEHFEALPEVGFMDEPPAFGPAFAAALDGAKLRPVVDRPLPGLLRPGSAIASDDIRS